MTPTPKLRWIRRGYADDKLVLQQWHEYTDDEFYNKFPGELARGAWRDVPMEEE